MPAARNPRQLIAWQLSWELKRRVYELTKVPPASRDFKFCDDIRRAARSAPFNTAEGFYRYTPREFRRFLRLARGSLGEVKDQLLHALDENYVNEQEFDALDFLVYRAIRANTELQKYLSTCPPNPPEPS